MFYSDCAKFLKPCMAWANYVPPPPPNCSMCMGKLCPPPPKTEACVWANYVPPPHPNCSMCMGKLCPPPPNWSMCMGKLCPPPPHPNCSMCMGKLCPSPQQKQKNTCMGQSFLCLCKQLADQPKHSCALQITLMLVLPFQWVSAFSGLSGSFSLKLDLTHILVLIKLCQLKPLLHSTDLNCHA